MAVLDLIHGAQRSETGLIGTISGFIANARDYMARRALYNQTVRELRGLSTRELADLGLTPSSLTSVAYEAAWGRK
ncbi:MULTISPECIES: DUF1127 domain-containing protein [unclassified Paracoccus (in: a-proteobacteria)]|uniref:DUF1127 domain-containing protein n=1 Tax=unclassified Paracoccus (in: a-proteobacteria) TaxID=2688777 RepID=UPI0012B2A297|nr:MULTISPECIES: DUF1127 domain-containing protein [unclassified Paracoccus (in: a-proteobacteria)]UXU75264.1 DUF1127 domain-containing protein [Paracoccus sp. SMMA_5]UXU81166.1 DUF1127 domain-containing protein [Paracoccus sp. SMMA_5_TC]